MGLATDMVRFFHQNRKQDSSSPRSLEDFLNDQLKSGNKVVLGDVTATYHELSQSGFLFDTRPDQCFPCVSNSWEHEQLYDYGAFDFLAEGFISIFEHFKDSVIPIYVKKRDGCVDVGTGFLAQSRRVVTARHCVQEMRSIRIRGVEVMPKSIFVPQDDRIDVAVFVFDESPLKAPEFAVSNSGVLSKVLTMGYPQIQGFDSILTAETARIAGVLKSSTGQIVGAERSILDGIDRLLISARVKGGNSGGPVINRLGCVVGLVEAAPSSDGNSMDDLGYAIVTPINCIEDIEVMGKQLEFSSDSGEIRTT